MSRPVILSILPWSTVLITIMPPLLTAILKASTV